MRPRDSLYFTVKELAERWPFNEDTIWRFIYDGGLKPSVLIHDEHFLEIEGPPPKRKGGSWDFSESHPLRKRYARGDWFYIQNLKKCIGTKPSGRKIIDLRRALFVRRAGVKTPCFVIEEWQPESFPANVSVIGRYHCSFDQLRITRPAKRRFEKKHGIVGVEEDQTDAPSGYADRWAKDREEVLAAALYCLQNHYKACISGSGRIKNNKLRQQIETHASKFWPEGKRPPLEPYGIDRLVGKCLNKGKIRD